RRRDDRPRPRQPEVVVEAKEQPPDRVLERLQNAEDEHADHAKSTPPRDHGLHRTSRQAAFSVPRTGPYFRIASLAYCEHDGWYLQVGAPATPRPGTSPWKTRLRSFTLPLRASAPS